MGTWNPGPGPTDGNDTFVGDETDETANGGLGDDTLDGAGGADTLTWAAGNDTLLGGAGADMIYLLGGTDIATLTIDGGDGEDLVRISTANLSVGSVMSGVETLVIVGGPLAALTIGDEDFLNGVSTLRIRGTIALSNPGTLDLSGFDIPSSFVFDGVTYAARLQFAAVETGASTFIMAADSTAEVNALGNAYGDTLSGGAGNDTVRGYGGNDTISGGAGNDMLDPGGGDDIVFGGAGDDIIDRTFGGNVGKLTVDGGDGFDVLRLDGGEVSAGSSFTSVEAVYLFDGTVNPTVIDPSIMASFEQLWGRGGHLIFAAPGTMDLSGLALPETFTYGLNTYSNAQFQVTGSGGDDTLILPLNAGAWVSAQGAGGNDTLLGGGAGDLLAGNAGDDTLRGYGGDDILQWDAGNDVLDAGAGNDTISLNGIGSASGLLTISGGDGEDVLKIWDAALAVGSAITGVETILLLRGNGPPNGALTEGLLAYTPGVLPAAAVYGSNNGILTPLSAGVTDLSNASMTASFQEPGGLLYDNVWRFQGTAGADTLLFPTTGLARLTAYGGEGADNIRGGAARDTMSGDAGDDALDGGLGVDAAVYALDSTGASWVRDPTGAWTVTAGAEGVDILTSVELLQFNDRYVAIDNAQQSFLGNGTSDLMFRNALDGQVATWDITGATFNSAAIAGAIGSEWVIQAIGDFSGDGRDDILLRNSNTGMVVSWRNADWTQADFLGAAPGDWVVEGVGDFNFDGRDDFLWRNINHGTVVTWLMNGAAVQSQHVISGVPNEWKFAAIADFNGDGFDEILWRHDDGTLAHWLTDGVEASASIVGFVPSNWRLEGTGDFDGDGRADLVWRNLSDGGAAVWRMDGDTQLSAAMVGAAPLAWQIAGVGDYSGDGKDDLLWRHDDGTITLWTMNGFSVSSQNVVAWVPTEWALI